jgi:hypothetical protein
MSSQVDFGVRWATLCAEVRWSYGSHCLTRWPIRSAQSGALRWKLYSLPKSQVTFEKAASLATP